ncbi:MAG: RelA/SpoT domain-containing protein [Cyanobacteria bacterium P01_C01_bin.72]
MSWTELLHSKSAVRRAGDYLRQQNYLSLESDKRMEAFDVLSNWRSSHAYPMQSMLEYFRKKAFDIDRHVIVVQRLKRMPSILEKLKREKGMKLDRMEDIAGCRIVISNQSQAYSVRDKILEGRTRNILHRERDYIRQPKQSGYRGLHLVYKYNGNKKQYLGHSVELQIRSKVQHSWATAVEVVGTFTRQALKASQGTDEWLNFFKLTSIAFEDIENYKLPKNKDTDERIKLLELIDDFNVLPKLEAFAVSTQITDRARKRDSDYFLIILDIQKSIISVKGFKHFELSQATDKYTELEKRFQDDCDKDIVLVSASSINGLKKAYPNYFADTSDFSNNIRRILNAHHKPNSGQLLRWGIRTEKSSFLENLNQL